MVDLKTAREAKGWTRKDLAERAGVAEDTVYEIELGYRIGVRPKTRNALADALGIDPDELTLEGRRGVRG